VFAGIAIAFIAFLSFRAGAGGASVQTFSYTSFVSEVTANKVSTAMITPAGSVSGKLHDGHAYISQLPTALNNDGLSALLLEHKVQVTGASSGTSPLLGLFYWLLLFLLIAGLFVWFGRRSRSQLSGRIGGIMSFGKSKAKVYDEDRPHTRFADIAGYEGSKAEVMEVVDFLQHPARYQRAGAVGPKGVLMVGPPGTGKTLLARAVAGEAGAPFFSLSGSSFVEMFVGVGASRVRDLFADARKLAPSIIQERRAEDRREVPRTVPRAVRDASRYRPEVERSRSRVVRGLAGT
jgi:cell division protease FtsH